MSAILWWWECLLLKDTLGDFPLWFNYIKTGHMEKTEARHPILVDENARKLGDLSWVLIMQVAEPELKLMTVWLQSPYIKPLCSTASRTKKITLMCCLWINNNRLIRCSITVAKMEEICKTENKRKGYFNSEFLWCAQAVDTSEKNLIQNKIQWY